MKKSEFVKLVLNDYSNTVFTTKDQVEVAIELFEKLGMFPPIVKSSVKLEKDKQGNLRVALWEWEKE